MKTHLITNVKIKGKILAGFLDGKEIIAELVNDYPLSGFMIFHYQETIDGVVKHFMILVVGNEDSIKQVIGIKNIDATSLSYQGKTGPILHFYDAELEDFCVDLTAGIVAPGVYL